MIGELQDKNKSPSLSIAFKMGYLLIWPVKRAVYSCKKPSKLGNISSFVGTVLGRNELGQFPLNRMIGYHVRLVLLGILISSLKSERSNIVYTSSLF